MNFEWKTILRDWGHMDVFAENEPVTVKRMVLKPGQAISLQVHDKRDQLYMVVAGQGRITRSLQNFKEKNFAQIFALHESGDMTFLVEDTDSSDPGKTFFFPRGTIHRAENIDKVLDLVIIEVAFGENDETDILRLDDKYGRE